MWKLWPHFPDTVADFNQIRRISIGNIIIRTQTAIISGVFACRACPIEINLADATHVVIGDVPSPGRYRTPLSNFNLHDSSFCWTAGTGAAPEYLVAEKVL